MVLAVCSMVFSFLKARVQSARLFGKILSHCAVRQTYAELWNKTRPLLEMETCGHSGDVDHSH